ncbi:uncharacterized protein ARMOST_17755 [Armillaria ostoyae]|uniref:Uncharacterized protein n=1 Tax=Armillaria ostoyae TaxID=47428 RepID=A0A284RZV5_ARMOS|nr:uncharacterized protein ARMOST_17755 [Armillaria ostoyae]
MAYGAAPHTSLDLTITLTPLAFSVGKDNQLGSSRTKIPFLSSATIDDRSHPSICFVFARLKIHNKSSSFFKAS